MSLYHDSLLAKAIANLPPSVRKPELSPHNRYTRFWLEANPNYKRLALAIVVIQYAQVFLEMGAKKRWGDKGRWRSIVGIEALKYTCPERLRKGANRQSDMSIWIIEFDKGTKSRHASAPSSRNRP